MTQVQLPHAPEAYSQTEAVQAVMRHVDGFNNRDVAQSMVWSRDALILGHGGLQPSLEEIEAFEGLVIDTALGPNVVIVEKLAQYGDTVLVQVRYEGPGFPTPMRAAYAFVVSGGEVIAEVTTVRMEDFAHLIEAQPPAPDDAA